jgi:ATP-dependent DNA helicase RecG
MNKQELINLLQSGENTNIEYKEAKNRMPSSLFETVTSFLNKEGGTILLGVLDDGSVTGVDPLSVDKIKKEIVNASNNPEVLDPPFTLSPESIEFESKIIIYIQVIASSQVHKFKGEIYDREHDCDLRLKDHNRISEIYFRKRTVFTEGKIYPALRIEDFRKDLLDKAKRFIRSKRFDHPWLEEDDRGMLRLANFYRRDFSTGEEGYTLAAALMFGKDETIQSILPAYKIEALVRIENLDRWDDRLTLRTNLIESYQSLMNFIRKHLPDKFYLKGDRRLDLREIIFREIVANIIIHREYTNSLSTDLFIYKDKVEAKNPNKPYLRGPLLLESFSPFPKNPMLRKFFAEMGWADEVGSGIKNVNKYLKYYVSESAKPLFIEDNVFRTTIPLVVYTFAYKTEYVFELLGIEKNNVDQELFEKIHSLEISSKMAFAKEKSRFLFELVSGWLRIGTKLPDLRLSNINLLDNPTVFEVPSLQEKSTNLLGKRFFTLMKILIATTVSISMDKLMTFMNYKNRKTFNELYMQPLIQNGLIERTIREKPNDPNQKYIATRKGQLFLGGFEW